MELGHWFTGSPGRLGRWCEMLMTEACVQVKAVMRAVKHWRDGVHWLKSTHRPNSYLLDLLVIKAAQHTHSSVHLCVCVNDSVSQERPQDFG